MKRRAGIAACVLASVLVATTAGPAAAMPTEPQEFGSQEFGSQECFVLQSLCDLVDRINDAVKEIIEPLTGPAPEQRPLLDLRPLFEPLQIPQPVPFPDFSEPMEPLPIPQPAPFLDTDRLLEPLPLPQPAPVPILGPLLSPLLSIFISTDVPSISAGAAHTCAITPARGLACWGEGGLGQLGNGAATPADTPRLVSGLANVASVSTGGEPDGVGGRSCATTRTNAVFCWGAAVPGGKGPYTSSALPLRVPNLAAGAVGVGDAHACALTTSATVKCWGDNSWGQLGDGSTDDSMAPVQVSGLFGVRAIGVGLRHSCALTYAGVVSCWGANGNGQLGDGDVATSETTPVQVRGLFGVQSIGLGVAHSCAVLFDGSARCWGSNTSGQLGDLGGGVGSAVPVRVATKERIAEISGGTAHTCASTNLGRVLCWGGNDNGQLGLDGNGDRPVPRVVPGVTGVRALDAGSEHTCAVGATGSPQCWGGNGYGQVGNDRAGLYADNAVQVAGLSDVSTVVSGRDHSCALLTSGQVRCWGADVEHGGFGDGAGGSATPAPIAGLPSVAAIAAGAQHTCAAPLGGRAWCWGGNAAGQLGNGTATPSAAAVRVAGVDGVIALTTGGLHSCALTDLGTVYCWGSNANGQLGNGTGLDSKAAVPVPGLTGVRSITAGSSHTCAVLAAGSVRCWGLGTSGQLGNGTIGISPTPVAVPGLVNATQISAGNLHTCARGGDALVRCWGANANGQLGIGTLGNSGRAPATLPTTLKVTNVAVVTAGAEHTCALRTTGDLECWGQNYYGQLGAKFTSQSSTGPVAAATSGVRAIDAGGGHTCAVTAQRTVRCWGRNWSRQLGYDSALVERPARVAAYSS